MAASSHSLNIARAAGALWKFRLRRSVRLLLALGEPGARALEVESRLRLVEHQLQLQLLRPRPGQLPLVSSVPRARAIIELAQSTLLSSEAMVTAILAEFSTLKAVNPLRDALYRQVL